MKHVGVLVDDLMAEATVDAVHIDMSSHGELKRSVASRHDCSDKTLYFALWLAEK